MGIRSPDSLAIPLSLKSSYCSLVRFRISASDLLIFIICCVICMDSIVPIPIVVTVVNRTAVSAMASTATRLRNRLARKLLFASVFTIFRLSFSKGNTIFQALLCCDSAVFDPYDPVRHLGNLVIVGNHDNRLVQLITGSFQQPDHIGACFAVQVPGRFIGQDDGRL